MAEDTIELRAILRDEVSRALAQMGDAVRRFDCPFFNPYFGAPLQAGLCRAQRFQVSPSRGSN
jgi:hypothetical protein